MLGYRVGFIGAGNMASAILNGALRQSVLRPEHAYISDPLIEKTEPFRSRGVHVTVSNTEVAEWAEIVVLAVKPQKFQEVLPELAGLVKGKCVVSIAAGISSVYVRECLPGAYVIRVMPNTPLLVGKGLTAIARDNDAPEHFMDAVIELFAAAGETLLVEEAQINAVIALSGSSPAYFFRFARAMTQEGERMGLTQEDALKLTAQAMRGSAAMLLRSGHTPMELERQVCSPGGTTLAALSAFDEGDLDGLITEALRRCVKRAEELAQ